MKFLCARFPAILESRRETEITAMTVDRRQENLALIYAITRERARLLPKLARVVVLRSDSPETHEKNKSYFSRYSLQIMWKNNKVDNKQEKN